jgi:zinc protease
VTAKKAVLLLSCAGAAYAQAQPFDVPPPVAPLRPAAIAAPLQRTLPNGLRVVVARRSGLPLVTTELLVRSGSEADPDQLAGLADLTATLLTKGTKRRTAPQLAQAAEALGGQLGTGAGWNHSYVAITVMRTKLAAALDLVADVTIHPKFAAAEVERARRKALDALSLAMAEPAGLAGMAAGRVVFGDGTYGHRPGGTPASLARIRREDLLRMHTLIYRPDNATLIFAGDVDVDEAMRLAEASFGAWARPRNPLAAPGFSAVTTVARAPVVLDLPGAGQAGIVLAAPSIARGAPDYYAGLVTNALLGGGYSSRLNQEIRIKRGLSYGADSSLGARRAGGLFAATAQTKNASAPEVVGLMLREIAGVGTAPPGADELEARKASLIGGFSRSLETTAGLAARIAGLEMDGVALDELPRVVPRVSDVTSQAIQDFALAHLRTEDLRVIVAGDAAQFGDALRGDFPDVRVIATKELDLDFPALVRPAPKLSQH